MKRKQAPAGQIGSSRNVERSPSRPDPVGEPIGRRLGPIASECALPNGSHAPAHSPQRLRISRISLDISPELEVPEFRARGGRGGEAAALMSVPEAPVHEHGYLPSGQHQIRPARKRPRMKAEAKAATMKGASEHPLWPRVTAANACHHPRSCAGIYYVGHPKRVTFSGRSGPWLPAARSDR